MALLPILIATEDVCYWWSKELHIKRFINLLHFHSICHCMPVHVLEQRRVPFFVWTSLYIQFFWTSLYMQFAEASTFYIIRYRLQRTECSRCSVIFIFIFFRLSISFFVSSEILPLDYCRPATFAFYIKAFIFSINLPKLSSLPLSWLQFSFLMNSCNITSSKTLARWFFKQKHCAFFS